LDTPTYLVNPYLNAFIDLMDDEDNLDRTDTKYEILMNHMWEAEWKIWIAGVLTGSTKQE